MAKKKKCKSIKDLEKRLICLKEKFDELTNQLEDTRTSSSSDEGVLEYHQLIDERDLLEKHMQTLERQLISEEKLQSKKGKEVDEAEVGCMVMLENSTSKIHFRLVKTVTSGEETQISINSPIGKAVMGKRVGEEIIVKTPKGKTHYKIKSLE